MIFTADCIFPVSGSPIPGGYLECDDEGTVISTGVFDEERFSGAPVIKCRGFIVPGFVNAHCHSELSHLKGVFRQGTGMDGFIRQINELRTVTDFEGRKAALREAFDTLISQGVVAMADISNCNESFEIKRECASEIYTRTFIEVFGTEPEDAPQIVEDALALSREAASMGLDAAPTPHSCYTMSPLLNRSAAAEGLKSGFISYHSQESPEEEDMVRYGRGALAEDYRSRGTTQLPVTGKGSLLYFIDNLSKAISLPVDGNLLLVHNVATDRESIDAALAAFKNPFWVLCPLSNLFIHRALPPIDIMRAQNLKICLGTDSLSSNLLLSMVAEMFCLQQNFPSLTLDEMLRWACLNGARALGKDSALGSFEKGKRPGVVLIRNIDAQGLKLTSESVSTRLL